VHINETEWVVESQHDSAGYHHITHIIASFNHNTQLILLLTTTNNYRFTAREGKCRFLYNCPNTISTSYKIEMMQWWTDVQFKKLTNNQCVV